MNKEEIREKFKKIRNEIKDKEIKSKIICDKIIKSEFYKNSKVIGVYSSLSCEVDTLGLIETALKDGKIVALPKVYNENELRFYRISKLEDLTTKSLFGIKEPEEIIDNFIEKSEIDLIIVPGICFDKAKNRIGFGKGYYDRYLFGVDNIIKIGICFDEQLLKDEEIFVDKYDVKMDMIITDK